MMVKDRYDDPTMKTSLWQKDMAVIGGFAEHIGAPTPLFSATLPIYAAALSTGHAAHDTAAVCAVLEAMAASSAAKPARRNADAVRHARACPRLSGTVCA